MEEQKSKIVEMASQAKSTDQQKMSYEQLEQIAHQLSEQARQLHSQLQKANLNNLFKRLDYLFMVVENGHMFKQNFLDKCIKEIEDIMTVPEETDDNKDAGIKE